MLRSGVLIGVVQGLLAGTVTAASVDPFFVSVQNLLREERVYPGGSTGVLDARTIAAVRHYQILKGLRVNGRLDDATLEAMHLTAPLPPTQVMAEDRRFLKGLANQRRSPAQTAGNLSSATHRSDGIQPPSVAEAGIVTGSMKEEDVQPPVSDRHRGPSEPGSRRQPLRWRHRR